MHLRKTTTSPGRGTDILHPLYSRLTASHHRTLPLEVLLVGAGVAVRALAQWANRYWLMRKIESSIRRLPLPIHFYQSYEPVELYTAIGSLGYEVRLRVADVNPYVLSIVNRQITGKQIAVELIDISRMPSAFVAEKFDVCIALNVLPHIGCADARQQSLANLIQLTRTGGYLVGASGADFGPLLNGAIYQLRKLDQRIFQKHSLQE